MNNVDFEQGDPLHERIVSVSDRMSENLKQMRRYVARDVPPELLEENRRLAAELHVLQAENSQKLKVAA